MNQKEIEKNLCAILQVSKLQDAVGKTIFAIFSEARYDVMDFEGYFGVVVPGKIIKITTKEVTMQYGKNHEIKTVTPNVFLREYTLYWFTNEHEAETAVVVRGALPWHKPKIGGGYGRS